jgi:hypothetical protein
VPLDEPAYPKTPQFRLQSYAIEMASVIGKTLASLANRHRELGLETQFLRGLQEFYNKTLFLIAGQLSSLEQTVVDRDHDWGWYRKVLNNKSMDVLLALLCLFVSATPGRNPSENMKRCVCLINRAFFHRMVLDDLLDIEEDVLNGTANSLVYMVVSQGRIAAFGLNEDYISHKAEILHEIDRTCLLGPEFILEGACGIAGSLRGDVNKEVKYVKFLITEALANRAADRETPFPELVRSCLARQEMLLEAWTEKKWGKVIAILKESGIVARIFNSITGRNDQTEVEDALKDLDDDALREVMSLFYIRTLRTYEKCLIACRAYL